MLKKVIAVTSILCSYLIFLSCNQTTGNEIYQYNDGHTAIQLTLRSNQQFIYTVSSDILDKSGIGQFQRKGRRIKTNFDDFEWLSIKVKANKSSDNSIAISISTSPDSIDPFICYHFSSVEQSKPFPYGCTSLPESRLITINKNLLKKYGLENNKEDDLFCKLYFEFENLNTTQNSMYLNLNVKDLLEKDYTERTIWSDTTYRFAPNSEMEFYVNKKFVKLKEKPNIKLMKVQK